MAEATRDRSEECRSIRTAMLGLAGTCVAFLFQILGQAALDRPLTIALYCFVVSIPLLVALAMTLDVAADTVHGNIPIPAVFVQMPLWLSPSIAAFGLGAYLWHYSAGAAWTFAAALLIAFVLFLRFQAELFRSGDTTQEAP